MAPATAEAGKLRALLEQAQQTAADLRALPQTADANAAAFGQLFRLAGQVQRLGQAAEGLSDAGQQAMWQQRAAWLHEELTALAAERLQLGEPEEYWSNITHLLYEGGGGCKASSRQAELEEVLASKAQEVASLQERLKSHEAASSSHQVQGSATSAETMELRTKLVVAQQEAQRRVADARDTALRLQATLGERDSLRKQLAEVQDRDGRREEELAQQAELMSQLRSESEDASRAADQVAELRAHNQMLSANLESHARVVERLIGLNTELMDTLNAKAFSQPGGEEPQPVFGQAHSVDAANGSASEALRKVPSLPGLLPVSTNAAHFDDAEARVLERRSVTVHAHSGALPPESITAALEAFLNDDDAKFTNVDLGFPGDSLASIADPGSPWRPEPRRGLTGFVSKAINLALYVAGNNGAVKQRARDLGEPDIV